MDTLNKATVSGKTAKFKALASKSCTRSADFAAQFDKIYADGGHVETDGWQVKTAVPRDVRLPKGEAAMKMAVIVAPQSVYPTKGSKPEQHKGGPLTFRLVLTRTGDHWLIKSLDMSGCPPSRDSAVRGPRRVVHRRPAGSSRARSSPR